MYYPYFRGKQFELVAIRESADLIAKSQFVPIIEPVRESLGGLNRALESLTKANARSIVIINPLYGDHRENGESISQLLEQEYRAEANISAGILLTSDTRLDTAINLAQKYATSGAALIHAGFTESKALSRELPGETHTYSNVFVDNHTNLLYRRHFPGKPRILLKDGFIRMKNADYPPVSSFSDLHITYPERGVDGYGDFLTIGDNYTEGGGPAYAVAIHLSYIDSDQDSAMFVRHFKSDTNDTPTDPAGKFGQALNKLVTALDLGDSHLHESSAISEFRELHKRGHFPGLGYVKKLSIKHHLETLAHFHSIDVNGL